MRIVGMARVKNEARWIARVVRAALNVCDGVVVLDDNSTDGTGDVCADVCRERVAVLNSPFTGLDEVRDKNYLLHWVSQMRPEYVFHFDGDEELSPDGTCGILDAIESQPEADAWYMRILYLWDSPDQVRVDGVYGRFTRPSLFKFVPGRKFGATAYGGNFHCGNVPGPIQHLGPCGARLLHYGYMERADRLRKFDWYNDHDPNNKLEDQYRHMIQGDVPDIPASARLRHGGPLTLQPLSF